MSTPPSLSATFALLNKNKTAPKDGEEATPDLMPTAKARHVMERLINGSPSDFEGVPLRPLVQDLFNWDGKNHTNKPLIRAFDEAISNKETYSQAVEMLGFLSASAPLLEADQIARILAKAKDTKTAFAPTLYTLNFSQRVKEAFEYLSSERRERILLSMWDTIHNGRWWNTTAAIGREVEQANEEVVPPKKLMNIFSKYVKSIEDKGEENHSLQILDDALWSEKAQDDFEKHIKTQLSRDIALLSEDFRKQLIQGKSINPDVAIYLSAVPWLAPNQRPESPVSGMLRVLNSIYGDKDLDLKKPKKPNNFQDYFENTGLDVAAIGQIDYLFDPNVIRFMENLEFLPKLKLKLITNKAKLRENAKHMGNCTLSYESNMDKGEYALFYATDGDQDYNLAISLSGNKWSVREVNSRFNRGVDTKVREAFKNAVSTIPSVGADYKEYIKGSDNKNGKTHLTYRYTIE